MSRILPHDAVIAAAMTGLDVTQLAESVAHRRNISAASPLAAVKALMLMAVEIALVSIVGIQTSQNKATILGPTAQAVRAL